MIEFSVFVGVLLNLLELTLAMRLYFSLCGISGLRGESNFSCLA